MNILIRLNQLSDDKRSALCTLIKDHGDTPIVVTDMHPDPSILETADAVIGNLAIDALQQIPHLQWVQLNSSGADAYAREGALPADTMLTCATGAYGIGISEYMIAQLLNMMKRIPAYYDNQKAGLWHDEGKVTSPMGKRVLVVGTGNIGMEFARRIKAFGADVVGVRRRAGTCPEGLSEIHTLDELAAEAAKADIVALTLPGTAETYHLFDRDMLLACKPGAYLINVGRGNVIDNAALCEEDVYGHFAGIYLDVCEQEPLPEGDPLYHVPNLLLTPHITGDFHLDITADNIYDICVHNYKAFKGEGAFQSVVDRKSGYAR